MSGMALRNTRMGRMKRSRSGTALAVLPSPGLDARPFRQTREQHSAVDENSLIRPRCPDHDDFFSSLSPRGRGRFRPLSPLGMQPIRSRRSIHRLDTLFTFLNGLYTTFQRRFSFTAGNSQSLLSFSCTYDILDLSSVLTHPRNNDPHSQKPGPRTAPTHLHTHPWKPNTTSPSLPAQRRVQQPASPATPLPTPCPRFPQPPQPSLSLLNPHHPPSPRPRLPPPARQILPRRRPPRRASR